MRFFGWLLVPVLVVAFGCQQAQVDEGEEIAVAESDTAVGVDDAAAAAEVDPGPGDEPPDTDEERIENAESAAPEAVAQMATILAVDTAGNVSTLREGTGAFTCVPDNPMSPGNDPMCVDANGLAWVQAHMSKKQPPQGKVGFGYMLQGGSDASNTDPYATEPAAGQEWIDTGPHVMIFSATGMMPGYTEQPGDPSRPFVMWPGTPYAHLMIPVE